MVEFRDWQSKGALVAKVKRVADTEKEIWTLFCPGCEERHQIWVPPWTFNGDKDRPTFRASLKVTYVKILPEGEAMIERGEYPPKGQSFPRKDMVCHSMITDGNIQFLPDCTHALAGQTVPLPEVGEA